LENGNTLGKELALTVETLNMGILKKDEESKLRTVRRKAHEQRGVAAHNQGYSIDPCVADRIHGMRCELENAIKDECSTLKEAIAPVPTIICNYVVRFGLDPEVEDDEGDATNPDNKAHRST